MVEDEELDDRPVERTGGRGGEAVRFGVRVGVAGEDRDRVPGRVVDDVGDRDVDPGVPGEVAERESTGLVSGRVEARLIELERGAL